MKYSSNNSFKSFQAKASGQGKKLSISKKEASLQGVSAKPFAKATGIPSVRLGKFSTKDAVIEVGPLKGKIPLVYKKPGKAKFAKGDFSSIEISKKTPFPKKNLGVYVTGSSSKLPTWSQVIPSSTSPAGLGKILGTKFKPAGSQAFDSRLVCVVFGQPSPLVRDIRRRLKYLDLNSGDFLQLFFIGFAPTSDSFDANGFIETRDQFEAASHWEYSGDTDVILLNAHYNFVFQTYELDFSAAMAFSLDKALQDKFIDSVPSFFEGLIRNARKARGKLSVNKASNHEGGKLIKEALKKILLHCLPKSIEPVAEKAFYAAIRDISKKGSWLEKNF